MLVPFLKKGAVKTSCLNIYVVKVYCTSGSAWVLKIQQGTKCTKGLHGANNLVGGMMAINIIIICYKEINAAKKPTKTKNNNNKKTRLGSSSARARGGV